MTKFSSDTFKPNHLMKRGLAHLGRSTSSFYADIRNLKICMYNMLKKFSNSTEGKIFHLTINLARLKTTSIQMNCYTCMCINVYTYTSSSRIFNSSTSCNSCKQSQQGVTFYEIMNIGE